MSKTLLEKQRLRNSLSCIKLEMLFVDETGTDLWNAVRLQSMWDSIKV